MQGMDRKVIIMNGVVYDAVTGMPVPQPTSTNKEKAPESRRSLPSHAMHKRMTSSQAMRRQATAASLIQKRPESVRATPTIARSPAVARFAPQASKALNRPRLMNDIQPAPAHPIAQKAAGRLEQTYASHTPAAVKPSSVLKKEAIDQALSKAPRSGSIKPAKQPKRASRVLSFASMAFSLLLLAGYLTYINLPNLSVRVAANQAGINAGYPSYRPDGYRLAGVNYDQGSVSLKFAANAGPQKFTITQQQTSWDSTAVRENYVKTNWGDNVVPYSERGLTIYAHEGNAAWVNGGILYTITGDAPLSASQVRSIAVSL